MCKHAWKKVYGVRVCPRCGLTMVDGKIMIDKKLPGLLSGKRKGKK